MRPLHLNLATRPYRDYRPLWIVVGLIGGLTLFLLVNNVRTAYRFFVNTRHTRAEIARVEQATETETTRASQVEEQIGRLDTRRLETQVTYVNTQIAERAFSWSSLLDDLERVVPGEVRLVTLAPSVAPNGPVTLNVTCIARGEDGLVQMIRALVSDPRFTDPFPTSEARLESGEHQFALHVRYQPDASRGTR